MKIKTTLYRQLVAIAIIICGIIFIGLGLLLPRLMLPIYERNIYQYLSQPLEFIDDDTMTNGLDDIAYLYVTKNSQLLVSNNLSEIIDLEPKQILENINDDCGKFNNLGKTYYYCSSLKNTQMRVTLTNNVYVLNIRRDIINTLIPTLIITLFIAVSIVVLWARRLVIKINILKKKIDNLDNFEYESEDIDYVDDELSVLSKAIDNIKISLKEQEEYKNQMYQNISHDFKTPLTVIKSYMEAVDDDMLDAKEARKVVKEQVEKLENKVHSLLYLNKLNYIKDLEQYHKEKVDLKDVIESSITKFKIQRQDVKFTINYSGNTKFNGTFSLWEAIIDNLLNNFVRYANKVIKITIKNNKITLYNDGPKIDEDVLNSIFSPYTKGMKGQFGLGLSIVKKTLSLLGYEINIQNERIGVSFIIK